MVATSVYHFIFGNALLGPIEIFAVKVNGSPNFTVLSFNPSRIIGGGSVHTQLINISLVFRMFFK